MADEEASPGNIGENTASSSTTGVEQQTPSIGGTYTLGGYHDIAEMMARFPVTAILKRFSFLNYLNLLYFQAELAHLEELLQEVAERDKNSSDSCRQIYFQSFRYLSEGRTDSEEAGTPEAPTNRQWKIIEYTRQRLKEYNDAILANSKITQLQMPSKAEVDYMRSWMLNNGNRQYTALVGADHDIWDETPLKDMVALCAREYPDPISSWIYEKALGWYHNKIGFRFAKKAGEDGTGFASTSVYERQPVLRVVSLFAISVASLAPIVSISALTAMKGSLRLRLGFMSLFTIIFCVLCSFFTGAKKTELLAASAAFAAVQVVFISGDNCCSH